MSKHQEWKKAKELEKKERELAGEKYCPVCETYKHASEFSFDSGRKDGLCSLCRVCRVPVTRTSMRKCRYEGYTQEHDQHMTCEICNVKLTRGKGTNKQCIDHDHSTGKVRGVLCTHCNTMLGYSRDNPEILRLGAKYLEERTTS